MHGKKVEGKVYRDFDEIIARHMDHRFFGRFFVSELLLIWDKLFDDTKICHESLKLV